MNIFKRWQHFFLKGNKENEPLDEWTNDVEEDRPLHTKPTFRFPLISDEERNRILTGEDPHTTDNREIEEEEVLPLYMHEKWRKDRENTIVHTSVGNRPVSRAKEKTIPPPEELEIHREVIRSNRRYTPSKFASPVYGYNYHRIKEEKTEDELIEINEKVEYVQPDVIDEVLLQPKFVEEELTNSNEVEQSSILEENVETLVSEPPVAAALQSGASVTGIRSEREEKKSARTTPFNVLMLKSDRQKMEKVQSLHVGKPVVKNEKSEQAIPAYNTKPNESYTFPTLQYLLPPEKKAEDRDWMTAQAAKLEEALSYFQIKGKVIDIMQGPSVTQFELTVGHGTKVSKIRNLTDDLKLALAAKDIRIQAPIPGKSSIGIEIPNRVARPVRISEIIGSHEFRNSDSPLEAVLGLDLTGKPATIDLRKMPHGLIAGATGSGKSVSINSILISLLYKSAPEDLRLLLIDPKVVELAPYNHIPHLISPVITDVKAANAALKWAVEEMERRYQLFAHTGVRDLSRYNAMAIEKRQFSLKLPYILIVIDELADLMMMAASEVEESISRIAQKARACGIHLIIATQRPSVDVITGLIKANIPTRIAFSVSSQIDSRTIIDIVGAERLLGKGDMLYLGNGMSAPARLQGTYVSDEEIERVVAHVRDQAEPNYFFQQEELIKKSDSVDEKDELFEEACRFIVDSGNASTSLLQRKFHIGYNRAARLIDQLEENGYISAQNGSKPREVFLTEPELSDMLEG